MKRCISIFMIMTLCLLSIGCDAQKSTLSTSVKAEDFKPVVLRYANQHPLDHSATKAAEKAANFIKEKTEGRVTLDIYPSGQLGDYTQIYDEIMMGNIDIAHYDVPETYDSRLAASLLPYLAMDASELKKVMGPDSYLAKTVSEIHASFGVKFLGYNCEGFAGVATNKPVTNPLGIGTDKGVLVRVPPMDVHAIPTIDLGYRTSTIPYSDTFTSIQTGIVDGWQAGTPSLQYLYFRDVIKYYYHYKMDQEATQIYMNLDKFNTLLPEDQKVLEEASMEMWINSMNNIDEEDAEYMKKLEDYGIEVITFTKEEIQPLADYCRDVSFKQLAKLYGENGEEFLDNILSDLK